MLQRRLLTVPGVVQLNTWGGTTKEYDVEVDLHKLDAYNVTLPQVISALGNANVNVGGRTINMGQQSVNIRGVGLMDTGGAADLTQGYKVADIENVPASSTACRCSSRTSPTFPSVMCRGSARRAATTRTISSPRSLS